MVIKKKTNNSVLLHSRMHLRSGSGNAITHFGWPAPANMLTGNWPLASNINALFTRARATENPGSVVWEGGDRRIRTICHVDAKQNCAWITNRKKVYFVWQHCTRCTTIHPIIALELMDTTSRSHSKKARAIIQQMVTMPSMMLGMEMAAIAQASDFSKFRNVTNVCLSERLSVMTENDLTGPDPKRSGHPLMTKSRKGHDWGYLTEICPMNENLERGDLLT